MIGQADPNGIFRPEKPVVAEEGLFRDVDLSDWIFSFQSRDPPALAHCLERWRKMRSSAWLVAALMHAPGPSARDEGLLDAAGAIPESSPGYLTARYHLFRAYEEIGQKDAARAGIDVLLFSPQLQGLPSSVNLFRGLRMLAVPSRAEFLSFAVRKPVLVTWDTNIGEAPRTKWGEGSIPDARERLDRDATHVLNRETPFRLLREAALGTLLPEYLQREALLTAFTRGLMLGEDLAAIAGRMAEVQPEIAEAARAYTAAGTDEERRFSAAFLILRRPEARPYFGSGITRQPKPGKLDPYRDNWWCPTDIPIELDSRARFDWASSVRRSTERAVVPVVPVFLTGEPASEAGREFEALGKLGAAGDFLASIVFPYAKSDPNDARVPEALYPLVRVVEYGCVDVNTWTVARDAFRWLHRRYEKTEWEKRTPVWNKNDLEIRRILRERY